MTIFLPLNEHARNPQIPAFLSRVTEPATYIADVVKAILKAKRVAVVCGAGISVQAGIPDFRSSDGLFQSIKRENPKESLSSGKDLFDASVFNSEPKTNLFCQMISRLAILSEDASPTPFHQLLRLLDERGKLLRVYTQNIDALEAKAGLSFGVPDHSRGKGKGRAVKQDKSTEDLSSERNSVSQPSTSKLPSPPPVPPEERTSEIPRCIPLHGTLQTMHCLACTHTYPLGDYLNSLSEGTLPDCPECTALETTRSLVGKRPRGIGKLRPSVVLYNEEHRNGEGVGSVVGRDLVANSKRSGPDLLLVVGTSLRVPGTKRIVREFSKAVRSRGTAKPVSTSKLPTPAPTPVPSPSSTPRRSPFSEIDVQDACDGHPIRTIYLNLDFPVPTREWDNIFDVWLQGDAQEFSELVTAELDQQDRAKEAAAARRRKNSERNSEDIVTPPITEKSARPRLQNVPTSKAKKGKKRLSGDDTNPTKKRRVTLIVKDPAGSTSPKKSKSVPSRGSLTVSKDELKGTKQNLPKTSSKSSLRGTATSQCRSPSSHKIKAKRSTEGSPTISTFQFQPYRIPEVLISVPDNEQILDYNPHVPRFSYYTPILSDTKKKGKQKGSGSNSPLDLLADAATVVPRAGALQYTPPSSHIYSYRNYTPSDAQFSQGHTSFPFPHHPSRCSYARSYTCECQVACPLSPTPSSSSYTNSPPSAVVAGGSGAEISSVPIMSLSSTSFEARSGRLSPASLPAAPTHLRPDISNLLNSSESANFHREAERSPSPSSPVSPTTPRAPKRKRGRVLYSTPSQRAKIRKATAAKHPSIERVHKYQPPTRGLLNQSEGQTLADIIAKIGLDSDTDVDVETNDHSSQFTLAPHH